jgi:hypothetical protein
MIVVPVLRVLASMLSDLESGTADEASAGDE